MRAHCFVCHRVVYLQRLHWRPGDTVRRSSAEQSREPLELSEETTLNHVLPPTATRKITGYQGASLPGEWHVSWFLVPMVASSKQTENYLMSFEGQHFFETHGVLSRFSVIKTLPNNRLSSLESCGSHLWQSYTRDIRSPLRGAFTWIILTIAAVESAFWCTLKLGLKFSTCTQWVSNRTGRKPADTHLAHKQFVRHGKGKCGVQRGDTWLESVSTSYSTHTHTNTHYS